MKIQSMKRGFMKDRDHMKAKKWLIPVAVIGMVFVL